MEKDASLGRLKKKELQEKENDKQREHRNILLVFLFAHSRAMRRDLNSRSDHLLLTEADIQEENCILFFISRLLSSCHLFFFSFASSSRSR